MSHDINDTACVCTSVINDRIRNLTRDTSEETKDVLKELHLNRRDAE